MRQGSSSADLAMRELFTQAASWLAQADDDNEERTQLLRSIAPTVARAATEAKSVPVQARYPDVVSQHLADAAAATSTAMASFAADIATYGRELHWSESYRDLPRGDATIDRFRDNYAYCLLSHPGQERWGEAPFRCADFALGFTLQAPDIFYPAHSHAAIELYGVIGGSGEWQRSDGAWVARKPGSSLAHLAKESHAMRTGTEAMLSCFVWISDLDAAVTMH